jgi:hypothetical protein
MFEEIIIMYVNPVYNIGLEDVRNAWLLNQLPIKLKASIYRGNFIFRSPLSGKRISYKTLKKGLIKKQLVIRLPYQLLPF